MTTATHSLDAASGATTVADLLARHGTRAERAPHRRSRAIDGRFGGALPAFPPADDAPTAQYRYDKSTVAALLAVKPAAEAPPAAAVVAPVAEAPLAEKPRTGRTGMKIAGLAFAGAVLAGGWALAHAQAPGSDNDTASGPAPSNNTPESDSPLLASAPVGAQVATLVTSSPTGTSALPAAPQQPHQGKFSGRLPSTTPQSTVAPAPSSQAAAPQAPAQRLPAGTYVWPATPDKHQKQNDHQPKPGGGHAKGGAYAKGGGHGNGHDNGGGNHDNGGGRHRR